MMTPQEVANCTFAKSMMGGYNMASVDDFLDKLTEDYSALYKENAALKAKLKVLVDKMAEYREMEDAMRSTLLTAQKMATSMVAEAEQKRTALITSASSAAKARQTELEREIAYQERRLEEVRRGVDQKLEQERKRLAAGQQALRGFIQDVRTVCNDQLAMLELLPELPVEEPAPPQVPAPAAAPPAAPVQEAAVAASATVSPEDEAAAAVEQNIKEVVSMISREKGQEPASGGAGEDPFAEDDTPAGEDGVELASTRVLNLEDLQFGRNYTKDR